MQSDLDSYKKLVESLLKENQELKMNSNEYIL